jgi:Sulfotransferase family
MEDPKPLFLIGNKRSGTSHLVRLLNVHPSMFVAHEADVVWILYQMAQGVPFRCYPWDGSLGMDATLKACADFLNHGAVTHQIVADIPKLYYQILARVMEQGSDVQQPHSKEGLTWIGDKKPVQQADPDVLFFIRQHFPDARFIHIIRHPREVVSSMVTGGRTWAKIEYWKGSPETILERWAIHEEWVLAAKDLVPVHSLRYEDLCADPASHIEKVFGFLGLTMPSKAMKVVDTQTKRGTDSKHTSFQLPRCRRAEQIMEVFGYNPS